MPPSCGATLGFEGGTDETYFLSILGAALYKRIIPLPGSVALDISFPRISVGSAKTRDVLKIMNVSPVGKNMCKIIQI